MHDAPFHPHPHEHGHDHAHPHAHPGTGHNGPPAEYLHSHPHSGAGGAEELKVLTAAFVEGFRAAADKTSWLRLAGIPFSRPGTDGLVMHLVDACIESNWQIGTASPAFATRELAYLPFPGELVTQRETMRFTYVSLTGRADVGLAELLADRTEPSA